MNPFRIVDAPAWLSLSVVSETSKVSGESTEHLQQLAHLARLVDRLQEVAEYAPGLHEVLPWLKNVSVWDLVLQRRAEARFPDLSGLREFREIPYVFPGARGTVPLGHSATATTLLSFFAGVTQPVAEMIESLYLSSLLLDPITVSGILRRMARAAGVKPLPQDVVTGVCASLVRRRVDAMGRDRARPRSAVWKVTWRPVSVPLRWPQRLHWSQLSQGHQPPQPPQPPYREFDRSEIEGIRAEKSFLVVVTEETIRKAGRRYEPSGKVLAFRCILGNVDIPDIPGKPGDAGKPGTIADAPNLGEAVETAVKLALYDALVFPLTCRGEFRRHISPPTLLRVQSPMPKAIQQAARVWRIKVEEITQQQCTQQQGTPGKRGDRGKHFPLPLQLCEWERERESERKWERGRAWRSGREWDSEWERELANRELDPVHYLRILDRAVERAYGYAPFLAKQRAVHQLGWRWRMFPQDDPLLYFPGLRELLPSFPATVGDDGSVEWQGWHYRDYGEDVLRYFPHAPVTIRPSPLAEAAILVYWKGAILCHAVADELRHDDGSYCPYWFPYPRLGE